MKLIKIVWHFVLNWIWQLPQHLLGLILIAVTRAKYTRTIERDGVYTRVYRYSGKSLWGISLGIFTVLEERFSVVTEFHELGHSFDSRYTGPLYLIIVGFLSAVVANLFGSRILGPRQIPSRGMKRRRGIITHIGSYVWYYRQWIEARADRFGGVVWHGNRRVLADWVIDGILRMSAGQRPANERETGV